LEVQLQALEQAGQLDCEGLDVKRPRKHGLATSQFRLSVRENPCRANLARGVWDEIDPPGSGRSNPSRV